jgi:hypothetical protein
MGVGRETGRGGNGVNNIDLYKAIFDQLCPAGWEQDLWVRGCMTIEEQLKAQEKSELKIENDDFINDLISKIRESKSILDDNCGILLSFEQVNDMHKKASVTTISYEQAKAMLKTAFEEIRADERRKMESLERYERVLRFLHDKGPSPERFANDPKDCYEYALDLIVYEPDDLVPIDKDPRWFEGWMRMIEAAIKRDETIEHTPLWKINDNVLRVILEDNEYTLHNIAEAIKDVWDAETIREFICLLVEDHSSCRA